MLFKRNRLIIPILAAVMSICVWSVQAADKDNQNVVDSVLQIFHVTTDAKGNETLSETNKANPGDLLEYVLTYKNNSTSTVSNIVATLPLSASMVYTPSRWDRPGMQASIDGQTFAALPLQRTVKTANGKVQKVDVPFSEYRFVRWQIMELPAGAKEVLRIRVKVVLS